MAAKAWGAHSKTVEEVFFQNEVVSLCLLINRRARTMRVVDFRAGATGAKRLFLLTLGQREGVEKAYTLVERDEVASWVKLGFAKEGNIPGFYKRSDAFLLGCLVPSPGRAGAFEPFAQADVPSHSEMRLTVAEPIPTAVSLPMTAAQAVMERTLATAKKHLKDFDKTVPAARLTSVTEAGARRAVAAVLRTGRALTAFEPFGRDVVRRYFVATTRGGFELHASTETQTCFGNAYLELLQAPRTEVEKQGTIGAIAALCDRLLGEDIVSCFSLAPSDDVAMASAFLRSGFRRTGLLLAHLLVGGERKDAILFSRKLANPGAD
jgi:hypothetical protein